MSIYDHKVKDADGNEVDMDCYRGKTLLIVNTATGCGFTPQYEGLQDLYEAYRDKGLEISSEIRPQAAKRRSWISVSQDTALRLKCLQRSR